VLGAAAIVAAAGVVLVAYALGSRGQHFPIRLVLLASIPLALVAGALLAAKRPPWIAAGAFLLMGFAGTLAANGVMRYGTTVGLMWLLLLAMVAALVAGHLNATRSRLAALWPGIAALAAYLAFTALQIPFAETTEIGARAFFEGPALIVAFFVFAYSQWGPDVRWRIAQMLVAVALLVGLYALFRLIVGPTAAEEAIARQSAQVGGDLALFGSFAGRQELGAWSAMVVPFLFAFVLAARGRSRWLASASLALMLVALLGSEVRTDLVAAAVGIVAATGLSQAARAFRGEAIGALLAVGGLAVAGMVAFALTVGSSTASTERFENIFSPGEDYSFQSRTQKWDAALAQINDQPFGEGLGTAGTTQRQYSRTVRLDNRHIDNSYLQLGVQQGYPGWLLFGGSVLLIGYLLVRSCIATRDRRLAALGIGAAASLASLLVCLMTGDILTSWGALLFWMLLGLGVGGFVSGASPRAGAEP
jgi:hypothetical protein